MYKLPCVRLSLQLLTVILLSEIRLTTANKTVPCDITGCKAEETCHLGKCVKTTEYTKECLDKPCPEGYYCNESGKCIEDTPCDLKCEPDEECYLQTVQCFVAPCPPVPSCRPITDKCASVSCSDGELCQDGACVDKCVVTLCATGTTCHQGRCLREVPCDAQCGLGEKCYIGHEECSDPPCPTKDVCILDRCTVIRCRGGYQCKDGQCVPDDARP